MKKRPWKGSSKKPWWRRLMWRYRILPADVWLFLLCPVIIVMTLLLTYLAVASKY